MKESTQVYYLEIVTGNVEEVCASYSLTLEVTFSDPVPELGNARTATLSNGEILGVRAPMHDAEESTSRPYYLVRDINDAISKAESSGATIAVPPMEIPNHGKCAIIMFGSIQSGFWEV